MVFCVQFEKLMMIKFATNTEVYHSHSLKAVSGALQSRNYPVSDSRERKEKKTVGPVD